MPTKNKKDHNPDLAHDERGSVSVPVPHMPHPHVPNIHVRIPEHVSGGIAWLKAIRAEQYIVGLAVFSQLLLAGYLVNFLTPKNVNYSFANSSCTNNLILFPRLHRIDVNSGYRVEASQNMNIAGYPILSKDACVTPVQTPKTGTDTVKISPGLLPFLSQKIIIKTPALPSVSNVELIMKMPTNIPATFSLDKTDKIFTYKLSANKLSTDCTVDDSELSCSTGALELKQSTKYNFKLERYFAGEPVETIFEKNIATIEAITVTSTSVKESQVVYNKPKTFTIGFSKTLESFDKVVLTNLTTNKTTPATVVIKNKSLVVTAKSELARQTNYALSVSQVTAPDLSSLASSFTLKFSTSGGPKVAGISIGTYGIYTSSNVILNFDSAVSSNQNVSSFVTLSTAAGDVPINAYLNDSTITIDPINDLPKCTAFTVRVLDGIISAYGITGGSAWAYNSRTICRSEFSIGSSVLGRSLMAYKFGSGPSTILFFGNMHGDEASGKYLLDSLVDNLESRFDQIPASRTIIVIPTVNPDGLASSNRYNSRQVDLNRNFPDVDWQADVVVAGGETLKNNGGTAPLSEPEAAALASFIQAQNPRLIITYHAVGSFIIANEAGDSTALANTYSSLSPYWVAGGSQADALFNYQITGTLEGWAANILGVPTLVIEQSSYYGNEFYSNQNAMWEMVNNL